MITMFCMEWHRTWHSRYVKLMLLVGGVFAVVSACESFRTHVLFQLQQGSYLQINSSPTTITQVWFGMDISTLFNQLYMLLFPIFAVMPYVATVYEDYKSGYLNQMLIRVERGKYFVARYLVNFIMGGISVITPSVLNLLIGALYAPVSTQIPSNQQSYIVDKSFAAELFYEHVGLYILMYLIIDFVWGGLLACFALVFLDYIRNKYVLLAIPFTINIGIHYIVTYSKVLGELNVDAVVPYSFLNPMQMNVLEPLPVCIITGVILLLSMNEFVVKNLKRDVL